jgi:hypothetical protein
MIYQKDRQRTWPSYDSDMIIPKKPSSSSPPQSSKAESLNRPRSWRLSGSY